MNINPQRSKQYCAHTETVLTTALNYLSRGWSVIPLVYKGKEAGRFRWKRFQTERISEAELRMLLPKKLYNLGIVLGDVSNGLVVRDFDIHEAYDQWKKDRPDLAASLPTVATSRGYHVYARMASGTKTQKYKDGELRANGGYVVAPPSVHPDGRRYQWVNSFRGDSELPILCRDDFIVNAVSGDTETAEPIETTKPIESAKPTEDIKANECHKEEVIQNAILASIPTQSGQREKKLFEFARRLLGVIGPDAEPAVLTLCFDRWWILAEEIVATKDYGTSLSAFLRGYANAKIAYGETMNQILLIATANLRPAVAKTDARPRLPVLSPTKRQGQKWRSQLPSTVQG